MIKIKPSDKKAKNPQPRAAAGLVQYQRKFIVIGGGNRVEQLNDIWEFELDYKSNSCAWKERTIPVSPYSQRTSQAVCAVNNKVYVHGGQNFMENKHYTDMFEYDIDTDNFRKLNFKEETGPEGRNSHSLVHDKKNKRLILFGGANEKGPVGDLHAFDLEKQVWEQLPNNYPELTAREMHTSHIYYTDVDLLEDAEIENNKSVTVEAKLVASAGGDKIVGLELGAGLKDEGKMVEKGSQVTELKVHKVNLEFDESTLEKQEVNSNGEDEEENEAEGKEEEKGDEGGEAADKEQGQKELDSNESEYMFVIGGRYIDKISSEIICISLKEKRSAVLKKLPLGICAHASCLVNDCIYIFGGTEGTKFLDSLYIYDILSGRLLEAMLPQNCVPPLIAASICSDESGGKLILYGGSSYENENENIYLIDTNYYSSSKNCKEIKDKKVEKKGQK